MCSNGNGSGDIIAKPHIKPEVFTSIYLCVIPISVQVNDTVKDYDFLVDTGSNKTMITTSVMIELGIVPVGEARPVSSVTGVSRRGKRCIIHRLGIGEIFFSDVEINSDKFSPVYNKYRIDGILGADVLRSTHLKIDYLIPLLEIAQRVYQLGG